MINRLALLLPLAFALTAAAPPRRAPKPAPLGDVVRVALSTEAGTITVDLDHKRAPLTVENFVRYVDGKRFDGIVFYRAMRLAWGVQPNGLIQAGTRGDPKRVLQPVAHEPTSQTGILHKSGTISMARFAPGTATGDFSILLADMPGLDAGGNPADPPGYAAFGQVVDGMDVVRRIFDQPLSPTDGQGVLKGQMLVKPVKLLTVRRLLAPPPAPAAATVATPAAASSPASPAPPKTP